MKISVSINQVYTGSQVFSSLGRRNHSQRDLGIGKRSGEQNSFSFSPALHKIILLFPHEKLLFQTSFYNLWSFIWIPLLTLPRTMHIAGRDDLRCLESGSSKVLVLSVIWLLASGGRE